MSTELAGPVLNLDKCSVILLDIAGTTTSTKFLKETLYSYVDKQAETFLKESWDDEIVKGAVKNLKEDELSQETATALVKELTEKNSDNEGLKTLQGLIYKKGYESGEIKAHVFPDVPSAFESWSKSRKVAIYSTGSLESQQLLFSHTTEGDLSKHISKYFDQSTGSKNESSSYEKISKELDVKGEEIVFITDSLEEAKAAKTAGLVVSLITREENDALPEDADKEFPVLSSFQDIVPEKSVKRKNEVETPVTEEERPSKIAKTEENGVEEKPEETAATVEETIEDEAMEVDAAVEKVETVKEKVDEVVVKESPKKTEEEIPDTKTENTATTKPTEQSDEPIAETKTEEKEKEETKTGESTGKEKPMEVVENAEEKKAELPKVEESQKNKDKVEDKKEKEIHNVEEENMDVASCDKPESESKSKKEESLAVKEKADKSESTPEKGNIQEKEENKVEKESKLETNKNQTETQQNKKEPEESKINPEENKVKTTENKVETTEKKIETDEKKVESTEKKVETTEKKVEMEEKK